MTARTPEEILAEFGRELVRPRRRRWRVWLVAALLPVLVVPGALAARSAWAPAPAVPDALRPHNAPRPDGVSRSVPVLAKNGWKLTAATCRFGAHTTTALWLSVPGGGAGRRCDALTPALAEAATLPPTVYVDPNKRRTLVFGAAPRGTTQIEALTYRAGARATRARTLAVTRGVYVGELAEDERVVTVIGLGARGETRLRCDTQSCSTEG